MHLRVTNVQDVAGGYRRTTPLTPYRWHERPHCGISPNPWQRGQVVLRDCFTSWLWSWAAAATPGSPEELPSINRGCRALHVECTYMAYRPAQAAVYLLVSALRKLVLTACHDQDTRCVCVSFRTRDQAVFVCSSNNYPHPGDERAEGGLGGLTRVLYLHALHGRIASAGAPLPLHTGQGTVLPKGTLLVSPGRKRERAG